MVYVFIADGFEEVEALTPVDWLRRCEIDVKTVGIGGKLRRGSHGITVITDLEENQVELNNSLEMIVLPGGMPGTLNLEKSMVVQRTIDYAMSNNCWIGAICAAPTILGRRELLKGKKAVCFEGFESQMGGAILQSTDTCVDGKLITAKGAGLANEFSLKLIEMVCSKERSEQLAASLQCQRSAACE